MDTKQLITADNADRARNTAETTNAFLLLHRQLTGRILSCFFEVYWGLGSGFLESVYAHALAVEFQWRGIRAQREVPLAVTYRGVEVGLFRADLIVEKSILLELKTADRLTASHEAQTLNYLHATGIEVALLLNFGPRPTFRRVIVSANHLRSRQLLR